MPEWIKDLSAGDQCLHDVLLEAWVASQTARDAVRDRGSSAPRTCVEELKSAEGILDAIHEGRTPRSQFSKKAAQAVRKFDMVYQCARFLEKDTSRQFAEKRPPGVVRVLSTCENSGLSQYMRRGTR
jgi:hypothetical protein